MSVLPSATELLDLVHRFYPRNVQTLDARYDSQGEARRLRDLRKTAQEESSSWHVLLQRLREQLPDSTVWELPYLLYDPCRCVRVSLAGSPPGSPEQRAVVLLISVLAPVHHLYASFQRMENKQVVEQRLWHPPLPPEYQSLSFRFGQHAPTRGASNLDLCPPIIPVARVRPALTDTRGTPCTEGPPHNASLSSAFFRLLLAFWAWWGAVWG